MPRPRSLAAAQTTPVRGDVAANVAAHVRLAHLAADAGARILVFPELSLTGYELDLAAELAFDDRDPRLAPLLAAATTQDISLVVGAPRCSGPHLHIAAFVLAPDGTTAVYTKHHLGAFGPSAARDGTIPPAEATVFHPGTEDPLLALGDHAAAIAICADVGRATHPQHAADRGADTYLASMFVIPSELDAELSKLATYARRHTMAVVLANYGAATGGLAAAGRSAIWSPRGDLLAQLPPHGEGVVVATESESGWQARTL